MSIITKLKIFIGKIALNESKPKKQKNLNAKMQAREANTILRISETKRQGFYKKATIEKNKEKLRT